MAADLTGEWSAGVVGPELSGWAEELEADLAHQLLELAVVDPRDRRLGARYLPGGLQGEGAVVEEARSLVADAQIGQLAAHVELAGSARLTGPRHEQLDDLPGAAIASDPGPLEGEARHDQLPPGVLTAEQTRARHDHVVEEDLIEFVGPGQRVDRSHGDPWRGHVDHEHGDAAVLRGVRVGADEQQTPVGWRVGVARPQLPAIDDEVVAPIRGTGLQRREIGPSIGLGEPLAPDHLAPRHRR